ncbi:hypothetical protein Scep_003412 [Stephania cephalantha]|uniref:Uncharacterized protein n=1 Tax=Stephania cephalantha TaxID=152367 RepID=A0AAP0KQG0_9MAGN
MPSLSNSHALSTLSHPLAVARLAVSRSPSHCLSHGLSTLSHQTSRGSPLPPSGTIRRAKLPSTGRHSPDSSSPPSRRLGLADRHRGTALCGLDSPVVRPHRLTRAVLAVGRIDVRHERRGGGGGGEGERRRSVNGEREGEGEGGREEQVIRWERFLPRRSLRVLLVESDDSTRHIVAALLRKCSYQVAAVADGLKAWDILKERHFSFDLVLTEVVMPSLSGIGLLSKIMNNEICKNIPVIMMSSHDSVGIVFQCMLKGASDFLVKPVRKNELRNLWQHVWRKCRSTNYGNEFENGSANADNRSRTGELSRAGSDTQSSCDKPDFENERTQKQADNIENEKRSCLEDTVSKLDKHATDVTKVAVLSIPEMGKATDKSKDLEIKVTLSIGGGLPSEGPNEENISSVRSPYNLKDPPWLGSQASENIDTGCHQRKEEDTPSDKVNEFLRTQTTQRNAQFSEENDVREESRGAYAKSFDARVNGYYSKSSPLLELSLRRPHHGGPDEISQEKHVLKHSLASAFSRYGSTGSIPKVVPSVSCIKGDESGSSNCQIYPSDGKCKQSPFPCITGSNSSPFHGGEARGRCQLSHGSNKEDVGPSPSFPAQQDACIGSSTETSSNHPHFGFASFSVPVGAIPFQNLSAGYGAALQPVIYSECSAPDSSSPGLCNEIPLIPSRKPTHSCGHFITNPQQMNHNVYDGNPYSQKSTQCMMERRRNGETAFHRLDLHTSVENAYVSGNHNCDTAVASGSDGSYENANVAARAAVAFELETGERSQMGSGKDADSDRSRREAALNKFRLKRKERCFEKKVRYHNRKRLAEQRPRLKGQFVRQAVVESTAIVAESDGLS